MLGAVFFFFFVFPPGIQVEVFPSKQLDMDPTSTANSQNQSGGHLRRGGAESRRGGGGFAGRSGAGAGEGAAAAGAEPL